ncbi:hypothetical protein [Angustibacter sp. Root456]|uniref:hypothetical protein n=1 Tax=Angustibacter sp. Root456 TaxID=1736539 RepID=UPI0012FBC272|nr:hypothetical protein [Angustibacter sp. Root456]
MNPRTVAVEDRARSLAEVLAPIDPGLAARLRECIPDGDGSCDEHLASLRAVVQQVATSRADCSAAAQRLLDAIDDLPAVIGRRGRVWVAEDLDQPGRFSAYWEGDPGWLEQGPENVPLDEVLAWARRRTDDLRKGDGRPF